MWFWLSGRGLQWIGLRRAHAFGGKIPHFAYGDRYGFRRYRSIELRPPKNKRWSRDDFVILFNGEWIVCHYKLVAINRWPTKEMAEHDFYLGRK